MKRRKRMDLSLKGRRALVTGSSSGLGEAIVKMLAQEGAAVVVHGRDSVRVDVIVKAISALGASDDLKRLPPPSPILRVLTLTTSAVQ
jgi:NAD(P)-dependent dehydrogenase (short-subunit alcohol dehydrogenase family)